MRLRPLPQRISSTFADWRWSASDLASNALRGHLAEFLVGRALGATGDIRNEWDSYDLELPSRVRIEVKSAAYFQTWAQTVESAISFGIGPTLAWDPGTNTFAPESQRCRQADVYVFALLAHPNKLTLNPLDVAQWEFYLLSSAVLDAMCPGQKQIGLASLRKLKPRKCSFSELAVGLEELQIVPRATALGGAPAAPELQREALAESAGPEPSLPRAASERA